MRVAVTGASGFVGGWIAHTLAERGHEVTSLGRRPAASLVRPVPNYLQWDVTQAAERLPEVDAVVHSAAAVGHWGDEAGYRAINVDGTRKVLEAFPRASLFVHISSASVYASTVVKKMIREDALIGAPALSAYGLTKAEAEDVVRRSPMRSIILRPQVVYGPGDTTLLPRFLRAVRRFGAVPVPGNGQNRISVTHVFNLTHAVERALDTSQARGAFNVADAEAPTVEALMRSILRRSGVPDRLLFVPRGIAWALAVTGESVARLVGAQREPTLTRYVVAKLADEGTLDISRARAELGYSPTWDYHTGPLA